MIDLVFNLLDTACSPLDISGVDVVKPVGPEAVVVIDLVAVVTPDNIVSIVIGIAR
jgi:hypothetical protein